MSEAQLTTDQKNTIITLIRRGERISRISSLLHVREDVVEKVFAWYMNRGMR